jgi:hypothetical protein
LAQNGNFGAKAVPKFSALPAKDLWQKTWRFAVGVLMDADLNKCA